MNIHDVFDRLFDFYKINSLVELSTIFGISQPALSQWKSRNSISAVKKKCRELGIYDKIFQEKNIHNEENSQQKNINFNENYYDLENEDNDNYYIKLNRKIEEITSNLNSLTIDEKIIDKPTFDLFKESYFMAINSDDLKELRIHIMEYTFKYYFFNFIESKKEKKFEKFLFSLNQLVIDEKIIDKPTFDLFKESYIKAKLYNDLKNFRIHIMEYTFNLYSLLEKNHNQE